MKTASLRELRYDFARIEAWLAEGHEVLLTKRRQPFARLAPVVSPSAIAAPEPVDYIARTKAIFGDRVFSAKEVEEMRAFETGEL